MRFAIGALVGLLNHRSSLALRESPRGPGALKRVSGSVLALGQGLGGLGIGLLCIKEAFHVLANLRLLSGGLSLVILLFLTTPLCFVALVAGRGLMRFLGLRGVEPELQRAGYIRQRSALRYLSCARGRAICVDLGTDLRPCQLSVQLWPKGQSAFRLDLRRSQLERSEGEGAGQGAGLCPQILGEVLLPELKRRCAAVELSGGWLRLVGFSAWPGEPIAQTEALLLNLAHRAELEGEARIEALLEGASAPEPLASAAIDALARLEALDALESCIEDVELGEALRIRALLKLAEQASDLRMMSCVLLRLGAQDEPRLLERLDKEEDLISRLLIICGLGARSAGKAIGPLRRLARDEGPQKRLALRSLRMIQDRIGGRLNNCELSLAEGLMEEGRMSLSEAGRLSPG